jgi:hypothetical protein
VSVVEVSKHGMVRKAGCDGTLSAPTHLLTPWPLQSQRLRETVAYGESVQEGDEMQDAPLNFSLFVARKNWLKSWESPPCFSANLVKIEEPHRGLLGPMSANFDQLQTLIH